jgi:HEAT repeat protein
LAAAGIVSGLVLGCSESDEKAARVAQAPSAQSAKPAPTTGRKPPLRAAVSSSQKDGGAEVGSLSLTVPTTDRTRPVSVTADDPTKPVLLAPGLAVPPAESSAEPPDEAAEIGPVDAASAAAFDALAAAYRDHKPADYEAAEGRLVVRGVRAVPVLLAKLTDARAETRELASMMVLRIVPETILIDATYPLARRTAVLSRLGRSLADPSADVRANIASTLALFPEDMPALVPALRKLLAAEMPHQRLMAVVALGNIGPKASSATADVTQRLEDSDADVRTAAKQTLALIRPPGE